MWAARPCIAAGRNGLLLLLLARVGVMLRHAARHNVQRLWHRDINCILIQPPQILRERLGYVDQVLHTLWG